MIQFLTDDTLASVAPAVFAEAPSSDVSARYGFVSTKEVLDALTNSVGVKPFWARQVGRRARKFARHEVKLTSGQPEADVSETNGLIPFVTLSNSHDGSSSYRMTAGIYQMHGRSMLMLPEALCTSHAIPHRGEAVNERLIDAASKLMEQVKLALPRIEEMRNTELNSEEMREIAYRAREFRYGKKAEDVNLDSIIGMQLDEFGFVVPVSLWDFVLQLHRVLVVEGGARSKKGRRMSGLRSLDRSQFVSRSILEVALEYV